MTLIWIATRGWEPLFYCKAPPILKKFQITVNKKLSFSVPNLMSVCIAQKLSSIVEKGEKIIKTTDNCAKLMTDDDNIPSNDDNIPPNDDDDEDQVRICGL